MIHTLNGQFCPCVSEPSSKALDGCPNCLLPKLSKPQHITATTAKISTVPDHTHGSPACTVRLRWPWVFSWLKLVHCKLALQTPKSKIQNNGTALRQQMSLIHHSGLLATDEVSIQVELLTQLITVPKAFYSTYHHLDLCCNYLVYQRMQYQ